jgi:hypothetical protein
MRVMAEFHLHGQIIKRSQGRSAVNAAAYRAGEELFDERLGKTFDYTRKHDVEESIILGPDNAPEWMFDRQTLWNTIEAVERHKKAQVAREFDIALPIELVEHDPEAAKGVLKAWANEMFVAEGLMADINFHNMKGKNPHAHLMSAMRRVHPQAREFEEGSRYAFESTKARDQNDWGYMDHWRETWADYANAAMAECGIDARIDHRTLIEQGVTDREPGIHIGPTAIAMEERGVATGRWLKNAMIWYENEQPWFEENRRYVEFLDAEEAEERRLAAEAAREAEAERQANAEAWRILAKADELSHLNDRLHRATGAVVTVASRSLDDTSEVLDGRMDQCLAAKVGALSLSRGKLATLPPPKALKDQKEVVAGLGAALKMAASSSVNVEASRLRKAQAGLRSAITAGIDHRRVAVEQLSRSLDRAAGAVITHRRATVTATVQSLDAARPKLRVERRRLASVASRLDVAATERVRDQASKLRRVADRLETERPTQVAHALHAISASTRRLGTMTAQLVQVLGRAGRFAGESLIYTWATILGRRSDDGAGPERIVQSLPKKEVAKPIESPQPRSRVLSEQQEAELLLYQLQMLKNKVVRRERGQPLLDLSLIPPRLQEAARRYGEHTVIQEWLDEADGVQANRLMKLLNGPDPVVKWEGDQLVAIPDRVSSALTEFANEKLQYDDVIRHYAEAAIRRWQIAAPGQQVVPRQPRSSSGMNVEALQSDVDIAEQRAADEYAARLAQLDQTKGKGVSGR